MLIEEKVMHKELMRPTPQSTYALGTGGRSTSRQLSCPINANHQNLGLDGGKQAATEVLDAGGVERIACCHRSPRRQPEARRWIMVSMH